MKKNINHFLIIFSLIFGLLSFERQVFSLEKEANFEPYYVGEVGSAWQFPSDHLPRGMTIGNFHIAFWNILNKNYLYHIEENTQGLRDSSILKDDTPINAEDSLTIRELTVVQQIMEMINHPTHPRSLIGLQETHRDVLNYLQKNLPSEWVIVTPPNQPYSQDIFLFNSNVFEFIERNAQQYNPKFPKTILTLTLLEKDSNKTFKFIQSHIPGGPINSEEGCRKFSEEAFKQYDPCYTIVLMGDMNQSPDTIKEALVKASKASGLPAQPFEYLHIDYPSHIDTLCRASWIDNFFVYNPFAKTIIRSSNTPEEVCSALLPIVELLKNIKTREGVSSK